MKDKSLKKLGLNHQDLDIEALSIDEKVIDIILNSQNLYKKSFKYIILNKIRTYCNNISINFDDPLEKPFPSPNRKRNWTNFQSFIDLEIPGLQLTAIARSILIILTILFICLVIIMLSEQSEFLLAWLLGGFSLIPLLATFFLLVGLVYKYGQMGLPEAKVERLIDEIYHLNYIALIDNRKERMKKLILSELNRTEQST